MSSKSRFNLIGGHHPLDIRTPSAASIAREKEQREKASVPTPDPVHRDDGSPIGLKRYCEIVTPTWNWEWPHLRALDDVLDGIVNGTHKRVIIQMPTRIGKTEKVTVRFPAYMLELAPTLPVMVTGYNDAFARRLSRKIRRILRGRIPMSNDRTAAEDWETAEGGGVRAAGVGVGIAGLPAGLIMIDDPTKNREDAYSEAHRNKVWEWFTEDVYTRLEPTGAIVLTMARRHEDDLVGRILASEDAADWLVLRFPALAEPNDPLGREEGEALCPDRFDEAAYAKMKRVIGAASFAALQQQRPAPAEGLIFQEKWLRHFYTTREHPIHGIPTLPDRFTSSLQSWDMTFKDTVGSDYVAGHVWHRLGPNVYLDRDRFHQQVDFPGTIKAVKALTMRHPRIILKLVEDKANGPAVIATLKRSTPGFVAVDPAEVGDKIARAHATTDMWEAGNVWLPHPQIAPWIEEFIVEHLQFPAGAHDDDVDAGTQAMQRFMKQLEIEERQRRFRQRARPSVSIVTTGL
jgi:predicted phage terminase large subunit-like protein